MASDPALQGLAAPGSPDASTWLDLQGLRELKPGADVRRPESLRAAAQQFEQLFLGMMLKSMRDANLADSELDGEGARLYQDLYDKQVTLQIAQGRGLGIADLLVRQLSPPAAAAAGGTDAAAESPSVAASPSAPRVRYTNPKLGTASVVRAYETIAASAQAASAQVATPARVAAGPDARGAEAVAWTPHGAPVVATRERESTAAHPHGASPGDGPSVDAPAPRAGGANAGATRRFADSPEDFVRKVLPYARAAATELGVAPAAIVAQAALETGWGRHVPAAADGRGHNLFGIKAGSRWAGARLERATVEVEGGVAVRTQAAFRAYESVADGFRDYVGLLGTSGRYAAVRAAGDDPARFAHALQSGGYATDPAYARKLLEIVNGSTLRQAMAAAEAEPAHLALNFGGPRPIT